MPRGNRYVLFTAVGGLISVAILAATISDLSSVDQAYERTASDNSRYYAAKAERDIRQGCLVLSADKQASCIAEAEATARENQRVEQDLAAQKITAWWTKIMGAAALIGMALSALGVALVWTTFREQKRATNLAYAEAERAKAEAAESAENTKAALVIAERNANAVAKQVEIAQDTAKRQLRAYLRVKPGGVIPYAIVGPLLHGAGEAPFTHMGGFDIKNEGLITAHNILIRSNLFSAFDPLRLDPADRVDALPFVEKGFSLSPRDEVGRLMRCLIPPQDIEAIRQKKIGLIHAGSVQYDDGFGETRETFFCFYYWGDDWSAAKSSASWFGNYST